MKRKFLSLLIFVYYLYFSFAMSQTRLPQNLWDAYDHIYNRNESAVEEVFSDTVLTVLGRWPWGPCYAVNTLGNLAYIGNGPTLMILDISEPASPEIVGEYLTNGLVVDIEIKETLAYLLTGKLEIFDLQDPLNPAKLGEISLSGGTLEVVVEETLAFVTAFAGIVYAVDISDPHQPVVRGAAAAGGQIPNCLAAKDSYVYVGNPEWPNLIIVDATNPDSLSWAGEVFIDGWGESVFIQDSLLYVGVRGFSDDHFSIYNVSDPALPVEAGRVVLPPSNNLHINIGSLTVLNGYAYLSTRLSGIFAVDISNPSLPEVTGNIPRRNNTLRAGYAIAPANGGVFAAYESGLWTVDVTDPDSLKELIFFPTFHYGNNIVLRGDLAFIASGWSGLWILDISQPGQPEAIANVNTGGWAADVMVSDSSAYITNYDFDRGDSTRGLWIIDISDIGRPQILAHHTGIAGASDNPSYFNSLDRSGQLIFLTGANWPESDSILEIIDVSDPLRPASLSVFRAPYTPYFVSVQDSFAYLATPLSGLRIIDWHVPENPVESFNIFNGILGITTSDSFAYVDRADTFFVLDISDPYSPVILGKFGRNYGSFSSINLSVDENYVYWAEDVVGVIDVSTPKNPREITTFGNHSFQAVAAQKGLVFATNIINGLWILRNNAITSLDDREKDILPAKFELYQNFPNPFNSQTTIEFYSPAKEKIILEVFNILGQKVKTLFEGEVKAGRQRVFFDSTNFPSGVYFYRLRVSPKGQVALLGKAPGISLTKKMLLLR